MAFISSYIASYLIPEVKREHNFYGKINYLRLNTGTRLKYHEGKMKRTLKRVKQHVKPSGGRLVHSDHAGSSPIEGIDTVMKIILGHLPVLLAHTDKRRLDQSHKATAKDVCIA